MLVEHARTLLGIGDATHAEYDTTGTAVIAPLACSLAGQTIEFDLTPASALAALHAPAVRVTEHTTCSYGLAPDLASVASTAGMIVAGADETGEVRAIERPDHPFFLATLYQPQLRSSPAEPHPIWVGFVRAVTA